MPGVSGIPGVREMKTILSVSRAINNYTRAIGKYLDWISALLVVVVCADVFSRQFFNTGYAALQELSWHLFGLIFLLGAAYTLRADRHVRVDVLYSRFSPKMQAWVNLSGTVFFLVPFAIIVITSSELFVYNAWIVGETSPDPGGLPARYLIKAAIPLGFMLVLIQALSVIAESLHTLLGGSSKELGNG